MILHDAARKHFARDHLDDDGVLHASENVIHREPLDDEDDPRRWLLLGYDPDLRILERSSTRSTIRRAARRWSSTR